MLNEAQAIFIIDAKEEMLRKMPYATSTQMERKIPILPFTEISSKIDLIYVFFHNIVESRAQFHCHKYMRQVGFESFYTFMPIPYTKYGMSFAYNPDYLFSNKENIERVFEILEDVESKKIFSARIRAIVSGCVGYLKVSKYEEYFHPLVQPEFGDIIIDGGISGYIESQLNFLKTIGADGKWF